MICIDSFSTLSDEITLAQQDRFEIGFMFLIKAF